MKHNNAPSLTRYLAVALIVLVFPIALVATLIIQETIAEKTSPQLS